MNDVISESERFLFFSEMDKNRCPRVCTYVHTSIQSYTYFYACLPQLRTRTRTHASEARRWTGPLSCERSSSHLFFRLEGGGVHILTQMAPRTLRA